jgi:Ca2+/Na+ antiporter
MTYLTRKQYLFRILTNISFLLLIINGGKLSILMVGYLIVMPYMVLTSSAGGDFGPFEPTTNKAIFLICIVLVYVSIFYLFKPAKRINPSWKYNTASSILILILVAVFMCFSKHNGLIEWVLFILFFLISKITLLSIYFSPPTEK